MQFVAEPRATVLFVTLHITLMDRTLPAFVLTIVIRLLIGQITMLHKKAQSYACLFEQVFAILSAKGDLAHKAFGCEIAGIPGSRRFSERSFWL